MTEPPVVTLTAQGLERLAAQVGEPHRSRLLLLAQLRRLRAKRRLVERRAASAFAHERTRRRGSSRPRFVIHLTGCALVALGRVRALQGLPDCGPSRVAAGDEVWLCARCRPDLDAVLGEYRS